MNHHPVTPDPFEMDDAAYVLGALSPVERSQYEHHLQTCSACAHAVAELAGLPGMLRRLPVEVVESLDAPAPHAADVDDAAPPTLLAGALHRVEVEERRHRRARVVRWATAATIGAAAATVGIIAVVDPGGEVPHAGAPPTAEASPTAEMEPTAEVELEALVDTTLSANVSLRGVRWGTKLQIQCSYPEQGSGDRWTDAPGYSLIVQDTAGASQQVATWNAVPGREFTIDAATAVREADIASFEVRSLDGTTILRGLA